MTARKTMMKIQKNKVTLDDGRVFSVGSEPYDKDGKPQLVRKELDWKHLFDVTKRSRARALCDSGAVGNLMVNGSSIHAYVKDKSSYCQVTLNYLPKTPDDDWERAGFECTCPAGRRSYYNQTNCEHVAAVLFSYEERHGPWMVEEEPDDFIRRVKIYDLDQERKRRDQERENDPSEIMVNTVLKAPEGKKLQFMDFPGILSECATTQTAVNNLKNIKERDWYSRCQVFRDANGYHEEFVFPFYDGELFEGRVEGELNSHSIVKMTVSRAPYDQYSYRGRNLKKFSEWKPGGRMDEYQLAGLSYAMQEYQKNVPSEFTDDKARNFFSAVDESQKRHEKKQEMEQDVRIKDVVLKPRILVNAEKITLGYRIQGKDGKAALLKKPLELVQARNTHRVLAVTSKTSIDFSTEDISEDSETVYALIESQAGAYDAINKKRSRSWYEDEVKFSSAQELSGSMLDSLYKVMEGKTLLYDNKEAGIKDTEIPVQHQPLKMSMKITSIKDLKGTLAGVSVEGSVPVMLEGQEGYYILSEKGLSRLSVEEEHYCLPFRSVADHTGHFHFQVGKGYLSEFYRQVLPLMKKNEGIQIDDASQEDVLPVLPPMPEFLFRLDREGDTVLLQATVSYGEKDYPLIEHQKHSETRDYAVEKHAVDAVEKWFDEERGNGVYAAYMDDDDCFDFLKNGIAQLEEYGTVEATKNFRARSLRQAPSASLHITTDSGLMDLSLTSDDVSPEDLIDLLSSYTLKKKYYRLRSGDYVDLQNADSLREAAEFLAQLDAAPADVIHQKLKVPVYRAIYLDYLLQAHEAVQAERDRTFRALVRNFRTVKDADYEPVEGLKTVMRPYQVYGFKWLRTLQSAGFGGILADDMGLGKTLQMISLLRYNKEHGEQQNASLVVCPASLVYNWLEELKKFAPALKAEVCAGTLSVRKKILAEAMEYDVLITSYDLLRRDVGLYQSILFDNCIIDEAQYIKNAHTAQSKAVRTIQAQHRFALTGTPIENRLSELWSIFDFLMPGFLYSEKEFTEKFESPIAKKQDEKAAEKLKAMTSPFILRRKKEDVLKDLPPVIEEVQYARLEGEQQKLYDAEVVKITKMVKSSKNENTDKIKVLAELTRIREICCDPSLIVEDYKGESAKRQACMDLIQSAIDGGHRMLVFSQFTSMLALLESDLKANSIGYYVITGETSKEKRLALVHAFNEGSVPVFLISLKAGGTGLNLTGADTVIHYDPWWNLAAENQATDRTHRIGQTRQVTEYKLIAKDTIEEKIVEMQQNKKDLAEAVLEGKSESLMSMTPEELLALLR